MKKRKGFTLIELLAVIVILAIIMVIAIPKILSVIENSKKEAAKTSTRSYVKAVKYNQVASNIDAGQPLVAGRYMVNEPNTINNVNYSKLNDIISIKGKKPSAGWVTISENKNVANATLCFNDYITYYINGKVTIQGDDCENIGLYTDITVDNEGWVSGGRTLTINFPEGDYKYYYKVSGKAKVNEELVPTNTDLEAPNPLVITLLENQNLETWMVKGSKKLGYTEYNEDKIDSVTPVAPTGSMSITGTTLNNYGFQSKSTLNITKTPEEGSSYYYSYDDGDTWIKYPGEPVPLNTTKVKLKTVRDVSKIATDPIDAIIGSTPGNTLGPNAFDGDKSSTFWYNQNGGSMSRDVTVEEEAWGKTVYTSYYTDRNVSLIIYFYDQSGTVLSSMTLHEYCNDVGRSGTLSIVVPENATKMIYYSQHNRQGTPPWVNIYEVWINKDAKFDKTYVYPKITSNGIIDGYVNTKINYYETGVKKYYNIDEGEWLTYKDNQIIRVNIGETLYAKGIDKYNTVNPISSYKGEYDGVGKLAFDDDDSTEFSYGSHGGHYEYKMDIDNSVWNKKLQVKYATDRNSSLYFIFYDKNGTQLASNELHGMSDDYNRNNTKQVTIPTNAVRLVVLSDHNVQQILPLNHIYDIKVID